MSDGDVSTSIGSRLREERLRLGLSQSAIGKIGGISKTTQVHYESDFRTPDAGYLARVYAHGVDVGYVVYAQRSADSAAKEFNRQLLADILVAMEELAPQRKNSLSNRDIAELAALFYAQFHRDGQISRDLIEGHLKVLSAAR